MTAELLENIMKNLTLTTKTAPIGDSRMRLINEFNDLMDNKHLEQEFRLFFISVQLFIDYAVARRFEWKNTLVVELTHHSESAHFYILDDQMKYLFDQYNDIDFCRIILYANLKSKSLGIDLTDFYKALMKLVDMIKTSFMTCLALYKKRSSLLGNNYTADDYKKKYLDPFISKHFEILLFIKAIDLGMAKAFAGYKKDLIEGLDKLVEAIDKNLANLEKKDLIEGFDKSTESIDK